MSAKSGKFGLKFWFSCDSKAIFILNAFSYVGKDVSRTEVGLGEHDVIKAG